jgi:hypothetical protein
MVHQEEDQMERAGLCIPVLVGAACMHRERP